MTTNDLELDVERFISPLTDLVDATERLCARPDDGFDPTLVDGLTLLLDGYAEQFRVRAEESGTPKPAALADVFTALREIVGGGYDHALHEYGLRRIELRRIDRDIVRFDDELRGIRALDDFDPDAPLEDPDAHLPPRAPRPEDFG